MPGSYSTQLHNNERECLAKVLQVWGGIHYLSKVYDAMAASGRLSEGHWLFCFLEWKGEDASSYFSVLASLRHVPSLFFPEAVGE